MEGGTVVAIFPFTGAKAGMDWWLDTECVMVEGESGVILYGEIESHVQLGRRIHAGETVGKVKRVLRNDKGRPTAMLHLELYMHGTRAWTTWLRGEEKPAALLDPTGMLNRQI